MPFKFINLKPILIRLFNYLKPHDFQSHGSNEFNFLTTPTPVNFCGPLQLGDMRDAREAEAAWRDGRDDL